MARNGYDVTVMTYGDADYVKLFKQAGISVIAFHPEKKGDRSEIAFIRKTLLQGGFDVMHLFNSPSTVNGLAAAKGLPVKVVLYRGYLGNVHWYDPSAYLKYLHPRVDKIVCNSFGVEQMFQKQLFFDATKALTINKGHRLEWYADIRPIDIRAELGIAPSALLLVNVANNRRMKGIPYLLAAMAGLPPQADVHLMLVGRDMENQRHHKILEKSSENKGKVHFLGFRKDALSIVAASDAFVLSSIKGESITKSVIEAMALGVAPIITDIAGNVELVSNEQNGLVVKARSTDALKSAILRLYNGRELCRVFGERSKQHVADKLHTDQTVSGYMRLYKSMGLG